MKETILLANIVAGMDPKIMIVFTLQFYLLTILYQYPVRELMMILILYYVVMHAISANRMLTYILLRRQNSSF